MVRNMKVTLLVARELGVRAAHGLAKLTLAGVTGPKLLRAEEKAAKLAMIYTVLAEKAAYHNA